MPHSSWHEIDERTWRFEDAGVRFFLLEGDERALLVDCGMQVRNARGLAQELTLKPLSLFLTHADRDHVGSQAQFVQVYASPSELVHSELRPRSSAEVLPVWDGDVLDLGGRELEAIAMPGHTPGSMALLDRSRRMLFSGDPIQRNGQIFMFGPMRSMPAYVHSLERLLVRAGQIDTIWPCHADCPIGPEVIPELIEGARKVERHDVGYEEREMHGTPIRAYDVGISTFLCDADF